MYLLLIMIVPLLLEFFIIWKREREKESDYVVILPKGYCKIIMRCTIVCILLAVMLYLRFGIEDSREVIIFLLCMCILFVLLCSIFTRGKIKIEEEKIIVVPLLGNKRELNLNEIGVKIDYEIKEIVLRVKNKKIMTISPLYVGYEEFLSVLRDREIVRMEKCRNMY